MTPYTGRLVRWGTDLYDRFLLPWYVRADIRRRDCRPGRPRHRVRRSSWFEPFFEFRFPLIGEVDLRRRQARAPRGDRAVARARRGSRAARHVTLRRLVGRTPAGARRRVQRGPPYRHLQRSRRCRSSPRPAAGAGVAGVRFKAWAPWSALHPTIDVARPTRLRSRRPVERSRSLGGCTYQVSHPGGRSYDTFPVNAAEAEARRCSRFFEHGHTARSRRRRRTRPPNRHRPP